jgi:hypothetical protein
MALIHWRVTNCESALSNDSYKTVFSQQIPTAWREFYIFEPDGLSLEREPSCTAQ